MARKEIESMTQDKAQSIIKKTYGTTAYAIGHSESTTETVIYWLYKGENEDNFRLHTITTKEA